MDDEEFESTWGRAIDVVIYAVGFGLIIWLSDLYAKDVGKWIFDLFR